MGLQYILKQVGFKVGLNPADNDQREVLLRFVNEATKELYHMSDMAGCLEEQYFKVNADQTVSLPEYVGQIRAMREAASHVAIKLSQMRPRYNQFNWPDEWRNWRLKGMQTLQAPLLNQSALTIKVKAVETAPITVDIVGATDGSARSSETIVMDAVSKQTTNAYFDVSTFTKQAYSQYDVTLYDIDDNQISFIPNNCLRAQFQVVDISSSPWTTPNTGSDFGWVEVLYKKALTWFSDDNDEFPVQGYDNIIVNKCLQLYFEENGNAKMAMAYYQKAQQSLAQIHEDTNRGTEDMVSMAGHPHDDMLNRVGFGRDYRYAYRVTGR